MTQMGWRAGHARKTSYVIRGLEPEPVDVGPTSRRESKARNGLKPMVRIQLQLCGDIPVRTGHRGCGSFLVGTCLDAFGG